MHRTIIEPVDDAVGNRAIQKRKQLSACPAYIRIRWQRVVERTDALILIGVSAVVVGQLALTYAPWFNTAFGTEPLSLFEGAVVSGIGLTMLRVTEAEKAARRRIFARSDGRRPGGSLASTYPGPKTRPARN